MSVQFFDARRPQPQGKRFSESLLEMIETWKRDKAIEEQRRAQETEARARLIASQAPQDYEQAKAYWAAQDRAQLGGYIPQMPDIPLTPEQEHKQAQARAGIESIAKLMEDQGAYGRSAQYNLGTGDNPNAELTQFLTRMEQTPSEVPDMLRVEGGLMESANNAADNTTRLTMNEADNATRYGMNERDIAAQAGVRAAQQSAQNALAGKYGAETQTETMKQQGRMPGAAGLSDVDKKNYDFYAGNITRIQNEITALKNDLNSKTGRMPDDRSIARLKTLQQALEANVAKLRPLMSGGGGAPAAPAVPAQTGPKVGDRKRFPNGKIGEWDGQGWALVEGQ